VTLDEAQFAQLADRVQSLLTSPDYLALVAKAVNDDAHRRSAE
jgi:hypothetical protein